MSGDNKLTYNVSETAKYLGLSRNSTYQGILTGEIPSIRVGKRILIPVKALEKMLDEAGKAKES